MGFFSGLWHGVSSGGRFLTFCAWLWLLPLPAHGQTFQSAAPQAILIDTQTSSVLYERAADEIISPASLAKLMTAELVFLALKEGRLSLDSEVVISENAWRRGGAPSGGSSMFAVLNSRIKVSDLMVALVSISANDAAIAFAETLAGDEATFAKLMTERARKLGLAKSTFKNSTGLPDPEQRVTAREIARLAEHIIRTYPEYYPAFGVREFTWNKIKQANRNPLLTMDIGADGMKTGNIAEAGFSLTGSAVQNGQRLIVVVSGLKSASERALEARKLLEWGFRSFETKLLFDAKAPIVDVRVFGGDRSTVPVVSAIPVKALVPRASLDKMSAQVIYDGPLRAPVPAGTRVGVLRVSRGNIQALEVPVETAEAVAEGTLQSRALEALLELAGSGFRRALGKS